MKKVRYWLISGSDWQTCGFMKTYGNTVEENGLEISKGKYYRLRKARIDKETSGEVKNVEAKEKA